MTSLSEEIRQLGRSIESHAEDLAELFDMLQVFDLDRPNGKYWAFLVSHGLVVGNAENGFTAHPALLDVFAKLSSGVSRAIQAPDIDEWMTNLRRLCDRYHDAMLSDSLTEIQANRRQIRYEINHLDTTLATELSDLEFFVDAQFGHVSTLKAKQRENEYLIGRTERLTKKLTSITRAELRNIAQGSPELVQLLTGDLLEGIGRRIDAAKALNKRLQVMLWQYRRSDHVTKLVRSFEKHFAVQGDIDFDSPPEENLVDTCFNYVASMIIHGAPDVADADSLDRYIDIANALPASTMGDRSSPVDDRDERSEIVVEPQEKVTVPKEIMEPEYRRFMRQALSGAVSAQAYWRAQDRLSYRPSVWMAWLHRRLDKDQEATREIRIHVHLVTAPVKPMHGTVEVRDIRVSLERIGEGVHG
ncbi:hypothetical protein P8631_08375 [Guyparkeria sp. 1SP6A2]|nr:hypothetical protein [Guyparkeria sp. 1SP6A2]